MDIIKLITIDKLIRTNRTGSPKKLATTLGLSERTVYTYIRFLKKTLNAPIKWSTFKESYIYTNNGNINFKWKD